MSDELTTEIETWLSSNWDPDLTVAEWWERLGEAHWAVPTWPEDSFGRDLSRGDAGIVGQAITDAGALGPPGGIGVMLAGPTIVAHGTDEQKARYLRPIVTGQESWCQLFSEPEAGSDLAGMRTSAVRDGDVFMVNGQKVWTSGGHFADLGMLMARTDVDVPKHKGISWFALNMAQPGIDVRPLREMTGRALFNEVFITDATVGEDALVGGLNNGWAVGNTTLMVERSSLGAGGGGNATSSAIAGTVAGHLDKRAGDFVSGGRRGSGTAGVLGGGAGKLILTLAKRNGPLVDTPTQRMIRQDIVRLHEMQEIARFSNLRQKAARAAGVKLTGGEPNIAKLSMTRITRLAAELGLALQGPAGMLWGDPNCDPVAAELFLFAPAVSIYGGTDEVQRNIIGERVLGLPTEPRSDKDVPFSELKFSATRS